MDEVLSRQPDDARTFLARTSVLDRLTGDLCDAVTESSGGRDMLVTLYRENLFVVPLDDAGTGTATTTSSPTCFRLTFATSARTSTLRSTVARASGTPAPETPSPPSVTH